VRWHASKRPPEPAMEPASHRTEETGPAPKKADGILALQRSAGNQAVQKLLPQTPGEPIPEGDRARLESAFGRELNEVRIHRDQVSGELAQQAGADAFTAGRDIYFAPGAYGYQTMAHEITHVVQQEQATTQLPGENTGLEQEAKMASSAVMAGDAAGIANTTAAPAMQRQPVPGAQPSTLKLLPNYSLTLDNFETEKSQLKGDHKAKLDDFAEHLKSTLSGAPASVITIVGYADAPGTELHNLGVGQQRANAVREYLMAKGISGEALHASSLGEHSPVVKTTGHEPKNRRVEIDVVERGALKSTIPPLSPATKPVTPTPSKPVDLSYHPRTQLPGPDEEFADRLRQLDQAVREAQEAENAKPGTSIADHFGRIGRTVAKKLGLPQWVQDRFESMGKDIPSKGAQAVFDQIAADRSLDGNTKNAIRAVIDSLMRMRVK